MRVWEWYGVVGSRIWRKEMIDLRLLQSDLCGGNQVAGQNRLGFDICSEVAITVVLVSVSTRMVGAASAATKTANRRRGPLRRVETWEL